MPGVSEFELLIDSRRLDNLEGCQATAKRILFTVHAIQQMSHVDRLITRAEVEFVIETGELLEDYPNDPRGHSCLIGGRPSRPIHVVCAPKAEYLAIHRIPISGRMISRGGYEVDCVHCKGLLERGKAPFSVSRKGYHVVWDAIPAWVCKQCKEPLFEGREVDQIQRALEVLDRETAGLAS